MKTGAAFIGFLFSAGVGFAVGYGVGNKDTSTTDSGKTQQAVKVDPSAPPGDKPAAPQGEAVKVPVEKSAQKGPNDALVTIVEFSEFQCPFCSRVLPTTKQIEDKYGKDVRIVFKHQPLGFHQFAVKAAEYSIAAREQGKFWEYHDKLFANQQQLDEPNLKKYAEELGLDVAKMTAYIESGAAKKEIEADQKIAAKVGATGTPAFFINGIKLSGAQPFANFQTIIDKELDKAKKLVESGTPRDQVYAKLQEKARENAPPPEEQARPTPPPSVRQNIALVDGTPAKGGKQPLVTIIEFSDFECPFCSRVNPTVDQVLKEYGDKVQFQFRHQPLSFHKRALPAAKASWAAHKQGKFWEYHDKLFANQKALEDKDLEKYAEEIKLDMKKFKQDMESPAADAAVQADQADANKFGARGTPTLFVNGVPIRGAQPYANFKTIIDKEITLAEAMLKEGTKKNEIYAAILKKEAGKTVEVPGGAPPRPSAPAAPTGPVNVEIGRAPVTGSKDAAIKIVVYSDFECPFCGRVNPSIEKVKETYGTKVAVAFKHYPLPFHQNAELAAVASLAAHKQGKFWEMHDKLFANQKALGRDALIGYAKDMGLNVDKFTTDLDDPSLKAWVAADMAEGSKHGVNGTPATFINGRLVVGAQPFEAFQSIIDEELKKKAG